MAERRGNDGFRFLLLNGASGAGKTTVARLLADRWSEHWWLHPDGLWRDTPDISPEDLLRRVVAVVAEAEPRSVIVDCQIGPASAETILRRAGIEPWTSVLLRCSDETLRNRIRARGWTDDLAPMIAWARWLHDETISMGHSVFDTDDRSPDEVALAIEKELGWSR